jgi:hypothetical protein
MAKGDVWLDYSGAAPISPSTLKSRGVKGVCRYLRVAQSGGSTDWKAITKAEFDDLTNNGIDVVLNFEWYEARCMEGAGAGAQDGADALAAAKALGYAKGAMIVFSHDQGGYDNATIKAYLNAAQQAMGDYYRADIYSGIDVVDAQVRDSGSPPVHGWQTLAWSNGNVGVAALLQNLATPPIPDTDNNVVMTDKPFGSHLQTLAGGGSTAEGDDMGTWETTACTDTQTLGTDWKSLAIDGDGTQSWFRGPCTFQAHANVVIQGLGPDASVWFRWATFDVRASDGWTKPDPAQTWPDQEKTGTGGGTATTVEQYGQIGTPPSGYQRRLRLQACSAAASGVSLSYVRANSFRR